MREYVIFKVGNTKFGISTINVEKIFKLVNISKIPDFNNHVEGVTEYQQEILPLINIKKLFKLPSNEINSSSQIIVVKNDNSKAGIIVDEVDDIEEANDQNCSTRIQSHYVEEVKILSENIISILNPNIINDVS